MNAKSLFLLVFLSLFIKKSCAGQSHNHHPVATLDVKTGQMLMVGFRGLQANDESTIAKIIKKDKIGGVFLFDYDVPAHTGTRNIKSPYQLRKLTRQLQRRSSIPLLVAIDQEGGQVSRLKPKYGFPRSVSAQYLGRLNKPDSTRYYARKMAGTLRDEGINTDLAPVVDLNINPQNPVIGGLERSFSADPAVVTRNAKIFIKALHKKGILTTLKHFPGHGSSRQDSHKGVVDVTQSWQKEELTPYKKLIKSGQVDIIMTAHIFNARLDSTYPATLSKPVITGLLRDSLGYKGVVISDDLQMGAIRKEYGLRQAIKRSILAGVDILSFANNSIFDPDIATKAHRIIKELVKSGELSEQRIDESYKRIIKLKKMMKN